MRNLIKNVIEEIKNKETNHLQLILEKKQLLENLDRISEELDIFSEKNNYFNELYKCKYQRDEKLKIIDEINKIKKENKLLKESLLARKNLSDPQKNKFTIANKKYLTFLIIECLKMEFFLAFQIMKKVLL